MPVSLVVGAAHRHCRRVELADVAQLLSTRVPFGQTRSALRTRHRVLRLPAAGLSGRSAAGDARLGRSRSSGACSTTCSRAASSSRRGPVVSSWPRIRLVHGGAAPSVAAGRARLRLDGVGRVAARFPTTLLTPTLVERRRSARRTPTSTPRIPFLWVSVGVLVLGAVLAVWHGFGGRGWPLPLAVALYLVVSMVGGVYASFVQRFVVTPNEQNMEQPFIEHNIAATRRAYALDRVEERELSGDAELTARRHHPATPARSRTSGSGITSRCCRRSRRSRRFGPTTTS